MQKGIHIQLNIHIMRNKTSCMQRRKEESVGWKPCFVSCIKLLALQIIRDMNNRHYLNLPDLSMYSCTYEKRISFSCSVALSLPKRSSWTEYLSKGSSRYCLRSEANLGQAVR